MEPGYSPRTAALALSSIEAVAVSATPSTVAAIDLERGFEVVRSKAAGPSGEFLVRARPSGRWTERRLSSLGRGALSSCNSLPPGSRPRSRSTLLSDPIGRFHRTFEIIFTLVFGSLEQA